MRDIPGLSGGKRSQLCLRRCVLALSGLAASICCWDAHAASSSEGSVVVRIDDPSGTHCIDSTAEQVTIYLRRAFVEKKRGIFTDDNKAGVLVRTMLAASDVNNTSEMKVPSVDMISIKDEGSGRVSLALEYAVASNLALTQGTTITQSVDILVNLAKTKGRNTFGQVIDIAGQVLGQSLLPSNPYTTGASKFLKFANQAIDANIAADNDEEIAHIGLKFKKGPEPDIKKCETAGNERTGALAVLRSIGKTGAVLIPVTDTEAQFCFSYSSHNTFELTAAHRSADGGCPAASEFKAVNNDYVMMLLSASPARGLGADRANNATESRTRCQNYHLPNATCGDM